MPVQFLTGDIFYTNAQTIAHGCNCNGRMGAGIARDIKKRHPGMFREYKSLCHREQLLPGGYYLYKESEPWILNLATQDTLGGARIEYVEECLENFTEYYEQEGITSLAMPRVAAGLGGLQWEDVKKLLTDILGQLPISVYVYENFERFTVGNEIV